MNNEKAEKSQNLTLKGYYESLPSSSYPKKDFVMRVMQECNVSFTTAHNWIKGNTKPKTKIKLQKLSEITGIPKEQLWQ